MRRRACAPDGAWSSTPSISGACRRSATGRPSFQRRQRRSAAAPRGRAWRRSRRRSAVGTMRTCSGARPSTLRGLVAVHVGRLRAGADHDACRRPAGPSRPRARYRRARRRRSRSRSATACAASASAALGIAVLDAAARPADCRAGRRGCSGAVAGASPRRCRQCGSSAPGDRELARRGSRDRRRARRPAPATASPRKRTCAFGQHRLVVEVRDRCRSRCGRHVGGGEHATSPGRAAKGVEIAEREARARDAASGRRGATAHRPARRRRRSGRVPVTFGDAVEPRQARADGGAGGGRRGRRRRRRRRSTASMILR